MKNLGTRKKKRERRRKKEKEKTNEPGDDDHSYTASCETVLSLLNEEACSSVYKTPIVGDFVGVGVVVASEGGVVGGVVDNSNPRGDASRISRLGDGIVVVREVGEVLLVETGYGQLELVRASIGLRPHAGTPRGVLGGVDGAVVRTRDRRKIWALGRLDIFPDSGIKPVVGGCVEGDVGKGLYPEVFLTKYVGVEIPTSSVRTRSERIRQRPFEGCGIIH